MKIAIVAPLDFLDERSKFYFFQNRIILRALKSALECNFNVNVVDYKRPNLFLFKKYDLVIGFGINFRLIRAKKKILLCFEQYPSSLRHFEKLAVKYYDSLGYKLTSERSGSYYKEGDFQMARKIIMLGDHKGYLPTFISGTNLDKFLDIPPAVLETGDTNNFEYNPFSKSIVAILSRGDALKGLPMLLELAKRLPEYEFNILGRDNVSLLDGQSLENIRCHGFIDHSSIKYRNIIASSVLNLNLSVSEASSTVILDGLSLGIPYHTYGNLGVESFSPGSFIQSDFDLDSTYRSVYEFLNSSSKNKSKMSDLAKEHFKSIAKVDHKIILREIIDEEI